MKTRLFTCGATALAIAAVLCFLLVSAPAAQNQSPAQNAPAADAVTPRLSNGHPDLTGYWAGVTNFPVAPAQQSADGTILSPIICIPSPNMLTTNQASYKLEYQSKVKEIGDSMYGDTTAVDPQMDCKPHGVPRSGFGGFVVSSPMVVAMLYEAAPGPYYRLIYTDGRGHPKDLDTSYMGHSIGHYEGDTLVVDTVGLNDETWLGGGKFTTIHSDKEHVIERITRKGDTVTYEATVEDPVMLTQPWVITPRTAKLSPPDPDKYYIQPEMCLNNDKPHFIHETDTDKFVCGWCRADSAAAQKAKAVAPAGGQ